jgi:catechol 2,3-dioxygenase-like lactoylglutathione lyase family enzyme
VSILSSRDLDETFAFYQRLGFERREESPATDEVLVLSRGEVELHFRHTPGLDPFANSATTYCRVAHPDQLHSEWELLGIELDRATGSRLIPPVDTGNAGREFALVDLSGNVVRFGSA